uniref:ORF51_1 protein n=1 Tax=Fopius arisanus TaxID=64838 RepID=A0A0C9QNQ7_9HYME
MPELQRRGTMKIIYRSFWRISGWASLLRIVLDIQGDIPGADDVWGCGIGADRNPEILLGSDFRVIAIFLADICIFEDDLKILKLMGQFVTIYSVSIILEKKKKSIINY